MPDFSSNIYPYLEAQSQSIDFNNGTISQAKMKVTYTGSGTIHFYLSADGGYTFEEVTNNVIHNFTATGADLRWKIGASGNFIITEIEITNFH
jgi:type V secretory pathway adhesin AidA